MDPASIYALLIPVNYKLKKEEITALVEAQTFIRRESKNFPENMVQQQI